MTPKLGQVWKLNNVGCNHSFISVGVIIEIHSNRPNCNENEPDISLYTIVGTGNSYVAYWELLKYYDFISEPKQIQVPALESEGIKFLVLNDHQLVRVFE